MPSAITPLITTAAAARILQVSENTIRAFADRGILTAHRTESGVRLFQRADVEQAAARRMILQKGDER